MLLKRLMILLFVLTSIGLLHAKPMKMTHQLTNTSSLPSFTHIYIQGTMDVTLHTGSHQSRLIIKGDSRDVHQVVSSDENGVLHVIMGNGYPKFGRVHVEIYTQSLSSLSYLGAGEVVGHHINSKGLDVVIVNSGKTLLDGNLVLRTLSVKGNGFTQIQGINSRQLHVTLSGKPRVQLSGVANIASLVMKGQAWFSLYWVKSDYLTIRSHNAGFIQLAGVVNVLDVELWGKARFNGRYLRATRSFVKTHDHSEADIATVKRQHTLATDASNIYFFNLPQMKADFMAINGSVLDLRAWESPVFAEPTRYNL